MSRDWRYLVAALIGVDLVCLVAASWGAVGIHTALSNRTADNPVLLAGLMAVTGLVVLMLVRAYDTDNLLGGLREYSAVVRGCVYGLAAVSLLSFVAGRPASREWIGGSWVLAAGAIVFARYVARRFARRLRRRGYFLRSTLLVGADANAVALAGQLESERSGMRVVGFLDDYHPIGSVLLPGVRVLGRTASLQQVAVRSGVADAIVMPQALPWETLNQLITAAAMAPDGPQVHLSAGFYDLLTTRVRFSTSHRVPLLTVSRARLSWQQSTIKTTLDYMVSAILLVSLAPAMCLMVAWQWLHGERHIIDRRRVADANGAPFDLLAFRSSAPLDSSFVRKLPGLLNVLAGQLTIVGPRPIPAGDGAATPVTPVTMVGLRPGLTGPWREVEDPAEQSLLDLYYTRTYSLSLDLEVLLRRVKSRFRRRRGGVGAPLLAERTR